MRIDNKASNRLTVIEINGRDRPGLLRDLTQALTDSGLQISSAHISTYGVRVVDVFYVRDIFGLKVEQEEKIAVLHQRLLDAVSPGAEEPGKGKSTKDKAKKPAAKAKRTKGKKTLDPEGIAAAE